jgi:hypothetical protein
VATSVPARGARDKPVKLELNPAVDSTPTKRTQTMAKKKKMKKKTK